MTPSAAPAPVVRPVTDLKTRLFCFALEHMEPICAIMRTVAPICVLGQRAAIFRYDDVKEIFLSDKAFGVPYQRKMDVIMGGKPFFLSMGDTQAYRDSTAAMRDVVRASDVMTRIIPAVAARAEAIVNATTGALEVVDELVRKVAFDVLLEYFGVPNAAEGDIRLWATRLFEFQFVDSNDDPTLDGEVAIIAPAMRAHVQRAIETRRSQGTIVDDVLGRCLQKQAEGNPQYTDDAIRCALIGFIAGGVPQLPMAAPQILEQFLRQPDVMKRAADAARRDHDQTLAAYVFEALRFDPMARVLQRVALEDHTIAADTSRARIIKSGTEIVLVVGSAMMDGHQLTAPHSFDPTRPESDYMHFGLGHHQCFGIHINRAFLPAILKPLLRKSQLRRDDGARGRLRKQGVFADTLFVRF